MNLVKEWQKGDIAAFETLFLRYKDMVLRTALSMVTDRAAAEDILQMTFIRAYEARGKFKGDEVGLRRWLYRITINLCMDMHRKRRTYFHLEQLKEKGFEPPDEFSNSLIEVKDELRQALDCLDGKHRSVVVLRYLHEMSYEEIAKTMNLPLGTVKSRLNTAIKAMRKKLVKEI